MYNIEERIESLKMDAINGDIPTWYAYQEINRLEQIRDKQDADSIKTCTR